MKEDEKLFSDTKNKKGLDFFMDEKGLDFKHKEVINIKDGRRLRNGARCMC